jgi:hypothetical protein
MEQMGDMKVDSAIIPGGLMSILQPRDVSVNKLFKDYMRRFYSEWMAAGPHNLTLTRKIAKPSFEIICEWFILTWGLVPEKTIVNSFKKTGISNALDGTKENCVWEKENTDDESSQSISEDSDNE